MRSAAAVAQGAKKADVIKHVREDLRDLPITRVHPTDGELCYILDRQAIGTMPFLNSYTHQGEAIAV